MFRFIIVSVAMVCIAYFTDRFDYCGEAQERALTRIETWMHRHQLLPAHHSPTMDALQDELATIDQRNLTIVDPDVCILSERYRQFLLDESLDLNQFDVTDTDELLSMWVVTADRHLAHTLVDEAQQAGVHDFEQQIQDHECNVALDAEHAARLQPVRGRIIGRIEALGISTVPHFVHQYCRHVGHLVERQAVVQSIETMRRCLGLQMPMD